MGEIVHKFAIGEEVEVFGTSIERERRAIVQRHEPFRGLPGYYVSHPDAREFWHCRGKWLPEGCLRAVERR